MKFNLTWIVAGLLLVAAARAVEPAPDIQLRSFEPDYRECFNWNDKFAHPPPRNHLFFGYPPSLYHAAINGEAVILVVINRSGEPVRLAVLSATDPIFGQAAVDVLAKSNWTVPASTTSDIWFYYRAVYRAPKQAWENDSFARSYADIARRLPNRPGFDQARLSGRDLMRIAETYAQHAKIDLAHYRKPIIDLDARGEHLKWILHFEDQGPVVLGGFFDLVIDDATGDVELSPGM